MPGLKSITTDTHHSGGRACKEKNLYKCRELNVCSQLNQITRKSASVYDVFKSQCFPMHLTVLRSGSQGSMGHEQHINQVS